MLAGMITILILAGDACAFEIKCQVWSVTVMVNVRSFFQFFRQYHAVEKKTVTVILFK